MGNQESTEPTLSFHNSNLLCPKCGRAAVHLTTTRINLGLHQVSAVDNVFHSRCRGEGEPGADKVSVVLSIMCDECRHSSTVSFSQGDGPGVLLDVKVARDPFGAGDGPFVRLKAIRR